MWLIYFLLLYCIKKMFTSVVRTRTQPFTFFPFLSADGQVSSRRPTNVTAGSIMTSLTPARALHNFSCSEILKCWNSNWNQSSEFLISWFLNFYVEKLNFKFCTRSNIINSLSRSQKHIFWPKGPPGLSGPGPSCAAPLAPPVATCLILGISKHKDMLKSRDWIFARN